MLKLWYDGRRVRLSPIENYVKYFHNFIRNLTISMWNFEENEELVNHQVVNFVKTKCDENLEIIHIDGNINLGPLCEEIGSFLSKVRVVEFYQRHENGHDETTFLKYCPNLTKLTFIGPIRTDKIDSILQQKYQQLKYFYLMNIESNLDVEKLKIFFQKNDKIQCIFWKYRYCGGDENNAVECIKTVNYVVNLEHLFLSIDSSLTKWFNDICHNLAVLCESKNFKFLELEFCYEDGANLLNSHANQLSTLRQFIKIHLKFISLYDVVETLRSLVYLKVIVFEDATEYDWDQWSNLDETIARVNSSPLMALPQIQEIFIEGVVGSGQLYAYVLQFVRHCKNLKKIYVPKRRRYQTQFDMKILDRERRKLRNACEVTILTSHKNATNLEHELVKLKYFEFEWNFCLTNPFQRFFISSENSINKLCECS